MSSDDTAVEQPDDDRPNRAPEEREEREEEDMAMLRNATAKLMEHFDTVHIFATRHNGVTGTTTACYGEGNWYARRGQVGDWITKQDADAAREE